MFDDWSIVFMHLLIWVSGFFIGYGFCKYEIKRDRETRDREKA